MYLLITKIGLLPKLASKSSLFLLKRRIGKETHRNQAILLCDSGPQSLFTGRLQGSLARLLGPHRQCCLVGQGTGQRLRDVGTEDTRLVPRPVCSERQPSQLWLLLTCH